MLAVKRQRLRQLKYRRPPIRGESVRTLGLLTAGIYNRFAQGRLEYKKGGDVPALLFFQMTDS
ncbi:MAG TPA: hypothetical protein DIT67_13885 [Octadecabacter sp.]|nr:hypothetical protein [Octadecabacter sp.]